ncbi:hypothetical protein BB561_000092 [Smittium simulii]|uniref:CAP-Gly domain-containing protein n=1 Tax=Smittium simulii TaxID=133385 RepID=A0A2T9Z0M9_9FUNG|nr:hypothetical protein BB561_000092 [Smittium simulii]
MQLKASFLNNSEQVYNSTVNRLSSKKLSFEKQENSSLGQSSYDRSSSPIELKSRTVLSDNSPPLNIPESTSVSKLNASYSKTLPNSLLKKNISSIKIRRATDADFYNQQNHISTAVERPKSQNRGLKQRNVDIENLRNNSATTFVSHKPSNSASFLANPQISNMNTPKNNSEKVPPKSGQTAINRGRNMLKNLTESQFYSLSRNLQNPPNVSDSDSIAGATTSELDSNFANLSLCNLKIGDLVFVENINEKGILKYLGEIHAKPGIWAGVELQSSDKGKNDGSPKKGIFVLPSKLKRIYTEDLVYNSITSLNEYNSKTLDKPKPDSSNKTKNKTSPTKNSRIQNKPNPIHQKKSTTELKSKYTQKKPSDVTSQIVLKPKSSTTNFMANKSMYTNNSKPINSKKTGSVNDTTKPPTQKPDNISKRTSPNLAQSLANTDTSKPQSQSRSLLNYKNSFDNSRSISPGTGIDRLDPKDRQEIELLFAENQMLKLENAHSKAQLAVGQYFSQDLGIDFLGNSDTNATLDDELGLKANVEAKANAAMLEIDILKKTLQNERELFSSRITELEQNLIEKVGHENIKSPSNTSTDSDEDTIRKLSEELEQTQEILIKVSQSAEDNSQLAKESQVACKHLETLVTELEKKMALKAEDYKKAYSFFKEITSIISNTDLTFSKSNCEPWLQGALFDATLEYNIEDLFNICKNMILELSENLHQKGLEIANNNQKSINSELSDHSNKIIKLQTRIVELENINKEMKLELDKSSEQTLVFNDYIGRLEIKSNTLLDDIDTLRTKNISLENKLLELNKDAEKSAKNSENMDFNKLIGAKLEFDDQLVDERESLKKLKQTLTEELNEMEAMFETKIFANTELELGSEIPCNLLVSHNNSNNLDDSDVCVLCNQRGHPILNCPTLNPPNNI